MLFFLLCFALIVSRLHPTLDISMGLCTRLGRSHHKMIKASLPVSSLIRSASLFELMDLSQRLPYQNVLIRLFSSLITHMLGCWFILFVMHFAKLSLSTAKAPPAGSLLSIADLIIKPFPTYISQCRRPTALYSLSSDLKGSNKAFHPNNLYYVQMFLR